MKKNLVLILIVAFMLRLINLNQSLWLDEATTANVVRQYGLTQIVSRFSVMDFHPPLYYWVMKLWTNIFGYSEIALRMPSVIFSLLTAVIIYRIVILLYGYIVGVWAMAVFLFNPLIVYYSQEARMYMMATFFITASLYFLINISQSQISKLKSQIYISNLKCDFIFFNIFNILSLLTFYGSIIFIVSALVYFVLNRQYKYFLTTCYWLLATLVLISPLLYQQFVNAKVSLTTVANWSLVLGKANIKNLLLIPVKFSIGRIDFYPKWLYYLLAGGWTGYILYQISKIKYQIFKSNSKYSQLLIFLLVVPILLGFLVSFFTPMLQYFRFLYLVPIFSILLAIGLSARPNLHRVGVQRLVVVAGFGIFSLAYLLLPQFQREDWKGLVKSLPANQPIYMLASSSDPVKYYNNKIPINELRQLKNSRINELKKSVIVIPYTADIHGIDYQNNLIGYNYQLIQRVDFRKLYYEIWKRQ